MRWLFQSAPLRASVEFLGPQRSALPEFCGTRWILRFNGRRLLNLAGKLAALWQNRIIRSVNSHCSSQRGKPFSRLAAGLLLIPAFAALAGDDIKVYRVPKQPAKPAAGHSHESAGLPQVNYQTPEGWTATPGGQMRVASFSVGQGNQKADVSVIPLPGSAGGEAANVNRWRGQVALAPLAPEDLVKTAEAVKVGNSTAQLYDLAGTNTSSGEPARILAVIHQHEGMAWFFKMTGDTQVVADQKPAFIGFLKSVEFTEGGAAPVATPSGELPADHPPIGGATLPSGHPPVSASTEAAPVSHEGQPKWTPAAHWKEVSGGQFLVAKFVIAGEGSAQAAVNVSQSAGDGGGLAGNVNRWRGQLGLSPLGAEELAKAGTTVKVNGGNATFVEMSGTDARSGQPAKLVGAIVPQSGQSWFYKLMGDAKLVDANREAFTKFVTTVQY